MWLLPLLDRVSNFAATTYYRYRVAGERVPRNGPVLLVANHPNSLFDPALVAAAARRPVRFLAKAPLFHDPAVGWLVRGAGAIPVYRTQDDEAAVWRNEEAFRAAHQALVDGGALALFPEGISHDRPSLAPLKTGAARIALGGARLCGASFLIIPVGLTLRGKERFRSPALALVGKPIEWDDLAREGDDPEAVKELTRRIAAALEAQTLNLASWEDAPLIEWAGAIYAAEHGLARDPERSAAVEREATAVLRRLREAGTADWEAMAREVERHARILTSFGLRPADLRARPSTGTAARWTAKNAAFLLATGSLGMAGSILFFVPYRLTGIVVDRLRPTPDVRSTYVALGGALFFSLWILLLAAVAAYLGGVWPAIAALLVLPPLALLTMAFHDRWSYTREVVRRFLLLRSRRELHEELIARQQRIAAGLHALYQHTRAPGSGATP